MISFATSGMFFHEYSCREIFAFAAEAGCTSIEFWPEIPDFWLKGMPQSELEECVRDNPEIAALTVHVPVLDLNPCSLNPGVADVSADYAVRAVELAAGIGAGVVTVHPGRRTTKRPPSRYDIERFGRYLGCMEAASEKYHVPIAIENMEPAVNSLFSTPERAREVMDAAPWLGFTLDVSHAMMKDVNEPARYIDLCGDRIVNVHMSRVKDGRSHCPLERDPLMRSILDRLSSIGFDGTLTLEIEDLNFPRVLTADEKIAVIAGDIAFMKECMGRKAWLGT